MQCAVSMARPYVESTTGAVVLGLGECLLSDCFRVFSVSQSSPLLRFQPLLIKPDMHISRIRLSLA
jgi:hypothetical protein